ncbi:MAG TPA: EboA domain-containing protein [Nannocystaceae bacterium]|nr:EboA domain-containing protein [Nannocystaceae bacterium]
MVDAATPALRVEFARCARRHPDAGTRDEARTQLVLAALGERDPEQQVALVEQLYRTGELDEQRSVLRMLDRLPDPARFVALAIEACRTNAVEVFAALANDNPYPARWLPDAALCQLVLKAIFIGVPIDRIVGLAARVDAEMLRMVEGYASERRAAGRPVPDDVAKVIALGKERT